MHWLQVFLLMPLPTQNLPPSSCHHSLDKKEILIPSGGILSKIRFSQQQKGVEKTMIGFIKIPLENMKMTWNIKFFIFSIFAIFFIV